MNFKKHPEGFLYARGELGIYFISGNVFVSLKRCHDGNEIESLGGNFRNAEEAAEEAVRLEHESRLQRLCDSIITEEVMEL